VSTDGGSTWERSTGLLSHEVARFTFHPTRPGEVWAGTMSGPHVSFDGGATWEPRRDGMPETAEFFYSAPSETILFDPAVADRLLSFGGSHREWPSPSAPGSAPAWGAVWESVDDGATWQRLSTVADGTNVVAAVWLDDGTVLAASLDRGVWRSDDGGASWSQSVDGLVHWNVRDLAAVPGTSTVYATLGEGPLSGENHLAGGVWRSDDGGITWAAANDGIELREAPDPLLTSRFDAIAMSPVAPDTLWTADLAFGLEEIYRSDDGGATWQIELEGTAPVPRAYRSTITAEVLVPAPDQPQLRFLAQAEYVLRQSDSGRWSDVSSRPSGDGWAGTGYSGLVSTDIYVSRERPGTILLAGLDGAHLIRSTDGGASWDRPLVEWDNWGGSQSIAVGGSGDSHLYVALGQFEFFNGIASSVDGGTSWRFAAGPEAGLPDKGAFGFRVDDIAVSSTDPTRVAATVGGDVHLSADAGLTWTVVVDGDPADGFRPLVAAVRRRVLRRRCRRCVPARCGWRRPHGPFRGAGRRRLTHGRSDDRCAVRRALRRRRQRRRLHRPLDRRAAGSSCVSTRTPARPVSIGSPRIWRCTRTTPTGCWSRRATCPSTTSSVRRGCTSPSTAARRGPSSATGMTFERVTVAEYDPNREGRVIVGTMGGGFFELPGLPASP
jgi:hypothetical protein